MQSHLENCPSDDFLYKCSETANVCTSVLKELRVLTAMKLFLMSSSVMSSTAGLKMVPESYTENISITGDNQGEKTPAMPVKKQKKIAQPCGIHMLSSKTNILPKFANGLS